MDNTKDIIEIIGKINSIGITVDNHDWEACQDLFIEEPEVDYSSFTGQPGGKVKASDLVEGWKRFLPGFDFTLHFISNHKVAVSGDKAQCTSYIYAIHKIRNADGGETWRVYGTYDHQLVRTSDGWKISMMKLNFKHQDGNLNLPKLAGDRMK